MILRKLYTKMKGKSNTVSPFISQGSGKPKKSQIPVPKNSPHGYVYPGNWDFLNLEIFFSAIGDFVSRDRRFLKISEFI